MRSPPELRRWVEVAWYSSGELGLPRERVLPSASTDIVANLGADMRLVEGEGCARIRGTTVSGLQMRPVVLEHPVIHEAVGFRLTPCGIRGILGVPPAAARDQVVDISELLTSKIDALAQACLEVSGAEARLDAGLAWLRRQLHLSDAGGDALAYWTLGKIDASGGLLSIRELVRESGYGATRFVTRFRDELGITPKQYARLVRFRGALDQLAPGRCLAAMALELGFADQAHMNREFRAFTGASPREVLAARYPSGLTMAESAPV